MKLLEQSKNKKLKGKLVTLTVKPVTKRLITEYVDAAISVRNAEWFGQRMAMIDFILNNCVVKLVVNGADVDHLIVSENADVTDQETLNELNELFDLVDNHFTGVSEEDEKK